MIQLNVDFVTYKFLVLLPTVGVFLTGITTVLCHKMEWNTYNKEIELYPNGKKVDLRVSLSTLQH